MNQGKIDDGDELGLFSTRTLNFSIRDPVVYKGCAFRFSRLFINYLYTGQLANQITTTIDGVHVLYSKALILNVQRTPDAAQRNDETEVKVIHKKIKLFLLLLVCFMTAVMRLKRFFAILRILVVE